MATPLYQSKKAALFKKSAQKFLRAAGGRGQQPGFNRRRWSRLTAGGRKGPQLTKVFWLLFFKKVTSSFCPSHPPAYTILSTTLSSVATPPAGVKTGR
jgi:hypothetical protein